MWVSPAPIFYSDVGSERIIPEQLEILQMSLIIAYAVIGGMESLLGAAAGAFISRYLLEAMRQVVITYPFGITTADGSDAFVWDTGYWALRPLRRGDGLHLAIYAQWLALPHHYLVQRARHRHERDGFQA